MENFEKVGSKAEVITEEDVRHFFEGYITAADNYDGEDENAFESYDDIKEIIAAMDEGLYRPAFKHIESEIVRMAKIQAELAEQGFIGDMEEGMKYVNLLHGLRSYLASEGKF